jgi:hypothetical protein
MKKRVAIFILFLVSSSFLFAQAPVWKVNEPAYQYTMTIVAKLNMDNIPLKNVTDLVGAFVGTTCRGVSNLTYVPSTKSYYAYLTVFSNTPGEAITFYIYNSARNKTVKVTKTIPFAPYETYGNLFQSYSIAEPMLNNKAELLTFEFLNIKSKTNSIASGIVKLLISDSYRLDSLTPVFTCSNGAKLLKNRIEQTSGLLSDNFTKAVNYEVLSEDESTINSYAISITQFPDPPLFYKIDAVCKKLGSIKVVSKLEGAPVQLNYGSRVIDNRPISNGAAIFSDLLSGTYVATIGNDNKIITINLLVK